MLIDAAVTVCEGCSRIVLALSPVPASFPQFTTVVSAFENKLPPERQSSPNLTNIREIAIRQSAIDKANQRYLCGGTSFAISSLHFAPQIEFRYYFESDAHTNPAIFHYMDRESKQDQL